MADNTNLFFWETTFPAGTTGTARIYPAGKIPCAVQDLQRAALFQESARRVDYAMDFLMPDFEPQLDLVVAHGHAKVQPHYGEPINPPTTDKASAVFRGRRLETITVGKMPDPPPRPRQRSPLEAGHNRDRRRHPRGASENNPTLA